MAMCCNCETMRFIPHILQKIIRIIRKFDETAPHETFLVLDATIGSNTVNQISSFQEVIPISGLVMNKLDGTAKGGALLKVASVFEYPIYFIGVGETKEDLKPFEAKYFVDNISIADFLSVSKGSCEDCLTRAIKSPAS